MEKSFLELVFEVLCGATVTLVQLLDCLPPHSLYTFASEPQLSVRDNWVFCACFGGLSRWHVQDDTVDFVKSAGRDDTRDLVQILPK